MGTLYVVGTPIGNLQDITLRALEVFRDADGILCEDTRVTQKLLSRFEIKKPLLSFHQHSKLQKTQEILELLQQGKNLALVSDAGTPGISDPGNALVKEVSEKLPEVAIVPIPGASAVAALASVCGLAMDAFTFLGFPPTKKGRKTFFENVAVSEHPVVFYESPYRIVKTLTELQQIANSHKRLANVVVGRELTKKFETIYRGTAEEVLEQLKKETPRGEFVVAVNVA